MPIYDQSESVLLVEQGCNLACRDTAKHRTDDLSRTGPHTVVRDHTAAYLQAPERLILQLTGGAALPALPGGDDEDLLEDVRAGPLARRKEPEFVLPYPILDAVLSCARARTPEEWYQSSLRAAWARSQIDAATAAMQTKHFHAAARAVGEVFGTLFVGYLFDLLTEEETMIFLRSWTVLQQLVDPEELMARLACEFGANRHEKPSLLSIKNCNRVGNISAAEDHAMRIGPAALRLAEQIRATEAEIAKLQQYIRDEGLPVGLDTFNVPLLHFSCGHPRIVRFVGQCMDFRPSVASGATTMRYAWWVLDRTAPTERHAIKLARLRSSMVSYILTEAEKLGFTPGADISRRLSMTLRIDAPVGNLTPKSFTLRWLETDLLDAEDRQNIATLCTRDRVEGWYNGRQRLLEKMRGLTQKRDCLAERYVEAVGGLEEPPPLEKVAARKFVTV